MSTRELAERALLESAGPEEAITVNQRALIDKILARYSAEFTVFRELLQNADDAGASECELRFTSARARDGAVLDSSAPLTQWTFRNNGKPFSGADWQRLRRIAEGNPDPERIGAFGVGFYSLFSVCEEPIVVSGDELMGFFWKGDALYTRRATAPATETSASGAPWTTFWMALREPMPFPESPLALSQFLATSLTFTAHVRSVALFLDDRLLCRLAKTLGAPAPLAPSRHLAPTSPARMLCASALSVAPLRLAVDVARTVLVEAEAAAQRERPSLRQTLASAFSKTAGTGIASMLASAFGARAAPDASPAPSLDDAEAAATVHAEIELRLVSARIDVSARAAFAREIERSTKKGLPPSMPLHMVYADDTRRAEPHTLDDYAGVLFDPVRPQLDAQGRVFIGFRTHQTTGFCGHVAARFIPTVERESLDLIDRYCAQWNTELLAVAGFVARAVYERAIQQLGARWDAGSEPRDALLDAALHAMQFFSFHRSSPSARVGACLEEAFFSCCTRPCISLLSTAGARSSDAVRFPSAMLADFCREIPVLPATHLESAEPFVTQLRARALVRDITMDDVFAELARRPLAPADMVACLRWWLLVAAHPSYDAALCARLLRTGVLALDDGSVQALADVRTVLHPGRLPPHVARPPTCLAFDVSRHLPVGELCAVFGWAELSAAAWLEYVIGAGHLGTNAEGVLTTLAWAWGGLSKAQAARVVELLRPHACVPTRVGLRRPGDAYFASVSLFRDLAVVELSVPVRGGMEKLLDALGVRRHVELQLVFDRLVSAGDWSHVDLLGYLAKQRALLSDEEMRRLRRTPMLPDAHGTLHTAERLYEPVAALAALGLPTLAWDRAWRSSAPEARLLFELGLRRVPPLADLLALASGADEARAARALAYLLEHVAECGYSWAAAAQVPFVPAHTPRGIVRCAPAEVCTDAAAAAMNWPVAALAPVDAAKLELRAHPSGAAIVERLCAAPPATDAEARAVFAFLAGVRLAAADYARLRTARIVPVAGGHAAPATSYFAPAGGAAPAFRAAFTYVDFGADAVPFLRRCGVSDEPSVDELVRMLMRDAPTFYAHCGAADAYLDVLRRVARELDALPRDLRQAMSRAPLLLGVRQAREDDGTGAADAYALRRAADVAIVDDAHAHMLFCEHVFVAPHDDVLEAQLYAPLGAPHLSSLVEERFVVAGRVLSDTPRARAVRDTVLERTPLFLHEKRAASRHEIQRDMAWLRAALVVVEVDGAGLQQTRVLRYAGAEFRDVQRCSAMAVERRQRLELHVASALDVDWFEVAMALAKAMLARQPLQDVLLFMTVLASPLRSLKRKGFHVDRVLAQQRHADAPLVHVDPKDDAARLQKELMHMFPDADPRHVAHLVREAHGDPLQYASERMLEGYPRAAPPPSAAPGAAPPPSAAQGTPPQAPAPSLGGLLGQWRSRLKKPSPLASGTSVRRGTGETSTPTPASAADIQQHVQRAIAASRADGAAAIQSQSRTGPVHDAATNYCDVSGVDMDLRRAGTVAGMQVYVSAELDPHATLRHNHDALTRLIELVYRPIGAIFGVDPRVLSVFCDVRGPSIAFNRGGSIYLNLRYYLAWHDEDVRAGRLAAPLVSVYFSIAHELAHNLVSAHNSEHEFYFSSIAEQYFLALAKYIAALE